MTLACVVGAVLAGCTGIKEPPGPLHLSLDKLEVHDRRNMTLHVTVKNTGEDPITSPDISMGGLILDADTRTTDYSEVGRIQSGGAGFPGLSSDLFDIEEVIPAGSTREFQLLIYYSPQEWISPQPSDLYIFEVFVRYAAGGVAHSWVYAPPCYDSRGEVVVIRRICDGRYYNVDPS